MYRSIIGEQLAARGIDDARRCRRIVYVGLIDGVWSFVPQKEALFACLWTGRGHVIATKKGCGWLEKNPRVLPRPSGSSDLRTRDVDRPVARVSSG